MRGQQIVTFVGLFVALGLPFILDLLIGRSPEDLAIPSRVVIAIVEEWMVALALLSIVLFWERQSLGSIGIGKMSGRDWVWGWKQAVFYQIYPPILAVAYQVKKQTQS